MKILLLHEMSGVHTNLKVGLDLLGHEADIATYGDGWKKYPTSINIGNTGPGVYSSLTRLVGNLALARKFDEYDIIQLISPDPFFRPVSQILMQILHKSRAKIVYIAAGSDAIYRNHVRDLKYYPPHDWFVNKRKYDDLVEQLLRFNAIVPVCWEYEYCMKKAGISTSNLIPFPVSSKSETRRPSPGTIRVFHPINRPNHKFDFKGTEIILKVFEKLQKRFSKNIQLISKGGMPYKKYLEESARADIVVDQLYSYSYGMSAAIGLRQGQVVLSGCEQDAKSIELYARSPVINVTPSERELEDNIIQCLNENFINDVGQKGLNFAKKFHDPFTVAQKYVDLYRTLIS